MSFHNPILALPPELSLHIFSICCQDGVILQVGHSFFSIQLSSRIPIPLVLSAVCSQWRQLATFSPQLWSQLRFEIGQKSGIKEDDEKESQSYYQITKYLLQRASGAPLTLFFYDMPVAGIPVDYVAINLAMDALCRRGKQWATVEFGVDESFFTRHDTSLQLLRGNLDNLSTFVLSTSSMNSPSIEAYLLNFRTCPSLRRVDLNWSQSAHLEVSNIKTLLPWGQLESLFLDLQFHAPSLFEIIPLCPSLKRLAIATYLPDQNAEKQYLKHPMSWNLQSLSVEIDFVGHTDSIRDFWENLTAPQLTSLDLCTAWFGPTNPFSKEREPHLLRFIRGSSSTLTNLSLRQTGFSSEQAVQMLQLLPNLTSLHIIERGAPDNTICRSHLFSHLLVDPPSAAYSPPFLPRLKNFKIVVNGEKLDHEVLVEAIRSRWIPDPEICVKMGVDSLQSVEVMFADKPWSVPESLLRLKELKREGLWVEDFRYEPSPECFL